MLRKKALLLLVVVSLVQGTVSAECAGGGSPIDKTSNCILYENLNLKTFDGAVLSGESKCSYTLVTINSNGVNLGINLLQNTSTIQVNYGSHTYDISVSDSIDLVVDGKSQSSPHYSNGVSVTKPGSMVLIEIEDIGFKIRFDGRTTELIKNNQIVQKMTGLCGNNDGCGQNDLIMKNGKVAANTKQYYDSWSLGGCTSSNFINSCGANARLQNQAKAYCENLFKNEKFAKCGAYSSAFMNTCTSNYCGCRLANRNNCMCDMLDAFVRTCQVKTNELISWRTSQMCPIDCRIPEQEYMTCAPNKRQLSCGEDDIDPSRYDCEEGCYCPNGLRLFQDRCVFPDECPCVYNDGVHKSGSTIAQDCNTCTCKKGRWDCTTKICTVEGNCVGDPHCTTFDGKKYDFQGKCQYYMVRGIGFDVICDHYIRNGDTYVKDIKSNAPSYCAKVIIQIRDEVIELEQKHNVKLNGYKLEWFPYISPGFRIARPSSELTTVSLRNDVTVIWNGNSDITVRIPTSMKGRVKGLLGTYTKTQDDDFLTPNGNIATDPTAFGNSWKVPDNCKGENPNPVEHPCKKNPDRKPKAEKECAALKSNLFEGCLDNVEDNYENCLYDSCQCTSEKNCVCEFYAEQAKRCAAKGKIIDWRKSVPGCEIKCPAGQTYQTCGNSCTRSCEDISTQPNCEKTCVEGCNCPEGQTLDSNNQCVPISKCPCIWDEIRFNPDFVFIDGDQKCTCTNALWTITTATTDDKKKYPNLNDLKKKCKADDFQVYTGCKRTNTITCQNKHLNQHPNYDNCQDGCECADGFVFDAELNMCIRPEDCPCNYNGISYPDKSERQERDKKCVCRDGLWSCTPNEDHWEKCSVWGNVHVRTFDELIYSFNGNCEYTLFEHKIDTNGLFRVNVKTEACNVGSCIKNVMVYIKDVKGNEDNVVITNGQEFTTPKQLANLVITNLDPSIMIDVVGLGVRVVWNKSGWVHIHVSRVWTKWNHVGLCGHYDDNPKNDLQTPNNENGVTKLVDYYRADKACPGSKELPNVDIIPPDNSCNLLYSGVFKTCGFLKSPNEYYKKCLIDANLQLLIPQNQRWNYYCQTLSAYAQECNDVNSPVKWRTNEICPLVCNQNSIYSPCETPCSKETCQNTNDFPQCTDRVCAEACASIPSPELCTVEGNCVGDPHCMTFDGKKYDFQGKCQYYMVRGIGFDVICDHYIRNGDTYVKDVKSNAPSYCAKVIIQIRDEVIELEQKHNVKLNGVKLEWFPYISPGFRIAHPSSELTTVSLRNDVTVIWNGNSDVTVKIPTSMKGSVKGLLGTYTKTQDDDFLMPNGNIATDPTAFGNSWKVPDSCKDDNPNPVEHPCKKNPDRKPKAEKECAALKSNLFEGCLDNVEDNYENCLYDSCQCTSEKNCVCEFYAEQAKRCAAKGKIIDWRKSVSGCEIKCPAGQTYQTCGNSCTRSCEDISTQPNCEKTCVEGCNCPEGQTLDSNNQCVPISKCPCIWDEIRFNPDFVFIDGDQKCTCTNALWTITTATTDDKKKYPNLNDLKKKCKADDFQVYTGCKRTNTITCQNKHLNQRPNYDNCHDGCECADGFVFDTELNMCIRPEDCPCNYNGISYPNKSERQERDKKCVCRDGLWSCTPNEDHWEKCSVWGNVHVRTFDELIYSFNGNCQYTLFEHKIETNGLFRVNIKTEACNVGSCIKNVMVYIKDVKGNEDNVVITNGQEFTPPKQLANLVITNLDPSIMIDVVGLGVRVVWNKNGWVHIHVSRVWTKWNHVGLCGHYDDNPKNDLHTPNNDNGVTKLVDYYRVDKACPGSKELPNVDIIPPDNSCNLLYSGIFKTCGFLKSPNEYYKKCLIDANLQLLIPENQRWNYYCQTLSAYAQECNDVNSPVKWRTNEICPLVCNQNRVYSPCETPCPKETCQNTKEFPQCPDRVCAEACAPKPCPAKGIYRDGTYGECVKKEDCNGVTPPKPPCKIGCECHPAKDDPSANAVDIHLDCNEQNKCGFLKLILNIYTNQQKK